MTNCTKCTDQLIVKEHLCEQCYQEHNEWLKVEVEERESLKGKLIGLAVSGLEKKFEQRVITKGQKDLEKYREGNRWI